MTDADPLWLITNDFSPEEPEPERLCSLYRFYDNDGVLLYVGITINPQARVKQHGRVQVWWRDVAFARFEHFDSVAAARIAEAEAIASEDPLHNVQRPTADRVYADWLKTRRVKGVAEPSHPANGHPLMVSDEEQMELLDRQTRKLFGMDAEAFITAWEAEEIDTQDPRLRYVVNLLAAIRVSGAT